MRNVQVIDSAADCPFGVFQLDEAEFALLFPDPGQDIQYVEDLPANSPVQAVLARLFDSRIRKREAMGIDGVLFRGLTRYKTYYREKREDSIEPSAINLWQRRLFGSANQWPPEQALAPIDPADCRYIQTIDGALNATHSIWQANNADFALIFPEPGQEVQFDVDLAALPRRRDVGAAFRRLWQHPVRKRDAMGIHGTIFYDPEMLRYKRMFRTLCEDGFEPPAS